MYSIQTCFDAQQLASDAWDAELQRLFGENAAAARQTSEGHGEEGSQLRKYYEAWLDARDRSQQAWAHTL